MHSNPRSLKWVHYHFSLQGRYFKRWRLIHRLYFIYHQFMQRTTCSKRTVGTSVTAVSLMWKNRGHLEVDPRNRRKRMKLREKILSRSLSKKIQGTSLLIQGLRLWAPTARGTGSIPGQGTRSHMLQLKEDSTCHEKDPAQPNRYTKITRFTTGPLCRGLGTGREGRGVREGPPPHPLLSSDSIHSLFPHSKPGLWSFSSKSNDHNLPNWSSHIHRQCASTEVVPTRTKAKANFQAIHAF